MVNTTVQNTEKSRRIYSLNIFVILVKKWTFINYIFSEGNYFWDTRYISEPSINRDLYARIAHSSLPIVQAARVCT